MIYEWARHQAERIPEYPAITMGAHQLTYEQLETKSNQLAGVLLQCGVHKFDRVGLLLEKTPDAVVGMLGINKAGGMYVPLDIQSPGERLMRIVTSADPAILLVDHHGIDVLMEMRTRSAKIAQIPWIWWSERALPNDQAEGCLATWKDLDTEPIVAHGVLHDNTKPAHLLFTSGSTGQPKGVVIKHENVEAFIKWAVSYFDISQGDRISGHAPLHFDLSTFDMYGAMAAGAQLFMVPSEMNVMPTRIAEFISENELDQWFSVPSLLSYMARFDVVPDGGYAHLDRLLWCGEVFPVPALQYWMRKLPGVTFTNLYGPTEATIASSYYTVPAIPESDQRIPIGKPCEGEQLYVLDDQLQQVSQGEIGDLYIAGKGLSPGYWRDKSKTEEVFSVVVNELGEPERIYKTGDLASVGIDGLHYFHGRADYQIKSRGYRIELGEIENALSDLARLREFAVVPVSKGGFEGTSIGCAYVCKDKSLITPTWIKKQLAQKLPNYMIPHYWCEYDKLPRNGNGKIDRRGISERFEEQHKTFFKVSQDVNVDQKN
ncbi:MAG: amino acid adenylation domain-containing protein [Bacteroidota bacterium]